MYRTLDSAFWTDLKVKDLPPIAKLLFLYLITNPHTHVSGIYYLPDDFIQLETKLSTLQLSTAKKLLVDGSILSVDDVRQLVWVRGMMKFQARGEKARKSAAKHLSEDLHNSPLIKEFLKKYPEVQSEMPVIVEDRVSEGHPAQDQVATPESLIPIPESPILNPEHISSAASPPSAPGVVLGEHGWVILTQAQYDKLIARCGDRLNRLVRRFDRFVEESPDAKVSGVRRRNRNAYLTILNWDDRDLEKSVDDIIAGSPAELPREHDPRHWCSGCEVPHEWTCTEEDCFMTRGVSCPEFMKAYNERHAVKA